ncbi:uncharacterized protein G2W53_025722 [Senna tora]|uniref:Uncharacterized protein n=1 Tax=Senna tora TaxID=362788 RepID=A0A834WF20_9FABA|nr:uncharacterized protein G2W53_025722 [Senna tora]
MDHLDILCQGFQIHFMALHSFCSQVTKAADEASSFKHECSVLKSRIAIFGKHNGYFLFSRDAEGDVFVKRLKKTRLRIREADSSSTVASTSFCFNSSI